MNLDNSLEKTMVMGKARAKGTLFLICIRMKLKQGKDNVINFFYQKCTCSCGGDGRASS